MSKGNRKRKTLQELTIKDNFMFGAVMTDEENCRLFLEMVLGFPIERVIVSKEKSIIYHPEYKGIRLDVYAADENHTHYNVEMQTSPEPSLGKRSRYYHSQLDMELLSSGTPYEELPDTYVIFICDYDPWNKGKYRYTCHQKCEETEIDLNDGRKTIYLSTHGENEDEVPPELVTFLKYVKANLADSTKDFENDYVKRLQDSVCHIKDSREMEGRFMLLEELIRRERKEAKLVERTDCILKTLKVLGPIPEELYNQIEDEEDGSVLEKWFDVALHAKSIEEFAQNM